MQQWVAVLMMLGCGGAQPPSATPRPAESSAGPAAAELIAVTGRGDVAATRAMLHDSVDFGGVWFEDTTCRRQFSAAGTIRGTGLDVLARCLAKLRLSKSERSNPYPDIAVLTYDPGLEIEVLFGFEQRRPQIRWIGYVSRRTLKDALPTITQRALEAHRTAGSIAIDEATRTKLAREYVRSRQPFGGAWLKVCLDARGAVTSAHARQTTSLELQRTLVAAIEHWTFQPVILGGQPTPICSLVWHDYPAGAAPPKRSQTLPFPVPPEYDSAIIADPTMLKRIVGRTAIVPDNDEKTWLYSRRPVRVVGSFFFCLTPQGAVDIVVTTRPTEVPRYDDKIRAAIRGWRYEPFLVDGQPSRVCTHTTVIYSQS